MSELSTTEYQRWYDYGVLPERKWDDEIAKLQGRYLSGELLLAGFEEGLGMMMGLRHA